MIGTLVIFPTIISEKERLKMESLRRAKCSCTCEIRYTRVRVMCVAARPRANHYILKRVGLPPINRYVKSNLRDPFPRKRHEILVTPGNLRRAAERADCTFDEREKRVSECCTYEENNTRLS